MNNSRATLSMCFALTASIVRATPLEDLASPKQEVRDAAAAVLRKTFTVPPRSQWEPLAADIKRGDTKTAILKRLELHKATRESFGPNSGACSMESYRLDDAWVLECTYVHKDSLVTLAECKLSQRIRLVRAMPPTDFSGVWTTYYVNGQRSYEIHYEKGKYAGDFTAFHSNGGKCFVHHYTPNGIDGEDTDYFPSGKVACRGQHKNGVQIGTRTYYNEDGTVRSTTEYPKK